MPSATSVLPVLLSRLFSCRACRRTGRRACRRALERPRGVSSEPFPPLGGKGSGLYRNYQVPYGPNSRSRSWRLAGPVASGPRLGGALQRSAQPTFLRGLSARPALYCPGWLPIGLAGFSTEEFLFCKLSPPAQRPGPGPEAGKYFTFIF